MTVLEPTCAMTFSYVINNNHLGKYKAVMLMQAPKTNTYSQKVMQKQWNWQSKYSDVLKDVEKHARQIPSLV